MTHELYTPEQAARSTLAALRWLSTLPRTVYRDLGTEFLPGRGATINVRRPITAGEARTYTAANRAARQAIQFNELDQPYVPVTLSDQIYNAVRLPDDFATFTLENLEQQVLLPQASSVVDKLNAPLVSQMLLIPSDDDLEVSLDGSNALRVVTRARKILNDRKVPFTDRTLAVGTGLAEDLLNLQELSRADASGSTEALREARIGRLRGFDVIEDPSLNDDIGIAYHRDAFAHVTRPTALPNGAGSAATHNQDGFSLRWIQHYNPAQLEDQSIVDTFVGATTLEAERAVKITKATS